MTLPSFRLKLLGRISNYVSTLVTGSIAAFVRMRGKVVGSFTSTGVIPAVTFLVSILFFGMFMLVSAPVAQTVVIEAIVLQVCRHIDTTAGVFAVVM